MSKAGDGMREQNKVET